MIKETKVEKIDIIDIDKNQWNQSFLGNNQKTNSFRLIRKKERQCKSLLSRIKDESFLSPLKRE